MNVPEANARRMAIRYKSTLQTWAGVSVVAEAPVATAAARTVVDEVVGEVEP